MTLRVALDAVLRRRDLSRSEASQAMDRIMEGGCEPLQVAALLAGMRAKGESKDELAGFAEAMRRHARPVRCDRQPLIDTCGTGGDGANTINLSTAAALVAAAGGAVVAKHGNRSVSSRCGSADVLEALGVDIDGEPAESERRLAEIGIAFLFAPTHHPAMRHVASIRRALGVRTVFNLLGPLCNPAGARRQVVGVFDQGTARLVAETLGELGSEHALVVCGDDGRGGVLDEVSICGPTLCWELRDGEIRKRQLDPRTLGVPFSEIEALRGGNATDNAQALERILGGEPSPAGDAVAVNAGAALYVAGLAVDVPTGVEQATEILAQGLALETLEGLRRS